MSQLREAAKFGRGVHYVRPPGPIGRALEHISADAREARQLDMQAAQRVLDNAVELRPLPDPTLGQKVASRIPILGGLLVEKFTAEQLRDGVEQNLSDIIELIQANAEGEPKPYTGPYTNRLELGESSAAAGLSNAAVILHEPSPGRVAVTFLSQPMTDRQRSAAEIEDPRFEFGEDGLELYLNRRDAAQPWGSRPPIKLTPFEELTPIHQRLAYLVTSDVAAAMQQCEEAGDLTIGLVGNNF